MTEQTYRNEISQNISALIRKNIKNKPIYEEERVNIIHQVNREIDDKLKRQDTSENISYIKADYFAFLNSPLGDNMDIEVYKPFMK